MARCRLMIGLLAAMTIPIATAIPASSALASGSLTAGSISSPATESGLISVMIASSSPLTALTVSFDQNGSDVLDLPMSDFTVPADDGDGLPGKWTLTSPISAGQLPFGYYQSFVTAADSGGDTVSGVFVGTFLFRSYPQLTLTTTSTGPYTLNNPDVTFAGTAELFAPDGTPTPFANAALVLVGSDTKTHGQVTTGSDGSFSITIQALPMGFQMEYLGDSQTYSAVSAEVPQPVITEFAVHMTAQLAVTHATYGQPDSVSGTVTYVDNGTTLPLVGTTVTVRGPRPDHPTVTVVTDSSGDFTAPVSTTEQGTDWIATVPQTVFLTGYDVSMTMTVAVPNKVTQFKATLSSFAVLSMTACITSGGPVQVEYASSPAGPWRPLGRLVRVPGACSQGTVQAVRLKGILHARLASAYYRVIYAGSYQYQPVTSAALLLSKLPTKITSFTVSPHHVARNGKMTVSGKLWAMTKSGQWQPYGHHKVIIVFRYNGRYYRYRHSPQTSAAGKFKWRFTVFATSSYFAQYNGDLWHFASASARVKVSMAAAVATVRGRGAMPASWPAGWPGDWPVARVNRLAARAF